MTRNKNQSLAARKAIKDIEGSDVEDVSEYIEHGSAKYNKMIEWIRKDLNVTTLKYQTIDDMVSAVGLPREKLCLYCWTGECPQGGCRSKKVSAGKAKAASRKRSAVKNTAKR